MATRIATYGMIAAVACGLCAIAPAPSRAAHDGFPYSIMTSEPGAHHGRAHVRSRHTPAHSEARRAHTKTSHGRVRLGHRHVGHPRSAARGSSGSVLPTPLPRTPLIPPEGGKIPTPRHGYVSNPGRTTLPSGATVPNLPHSTPETFQDRASRCAQQQGLFGVPGSESSTYMHACAM